ncbi:VWA domain-containing protein [bacterium]|nr:VWA domain-containing protein [bacterium]
MKKQGFRIYNLIILDESGSMESIKKPTISGFNELVQTIKGLQKEHKEQSHYVSFVTFNGLGIKTKLFNQPVEELSKITEKLYNPDATTPLYDAIGDSVLKLKHEVYGGEDYKVLVTILTDGEENASQNFTGKEIKLMIENLQQNGWTFTYIGANQDVVKVATELAIPVSNTLSFSADDEGVSKAFAKDRKARASYAKKISSNEEAEADYFADDSE